MRELERWYRLLLLAYPRVYRRERGAEVLTTLLDAARPGQVRPSTHDTWDLVAGGVRYRLTPPRGYLARAALVFVVLFVALWSGGTAAYESWVARVKMPDHAQVAALGTQLLGEPGKRTTSTAGRSRCRSQSLYDFEGNYGPARAEGWAGLTPSPACVEAIYTAQPEAVSAAYQRIRAEGWQLGELTSDNGRSYFWASKDDLLLRMEGNRRQIEFALYHPEPSTQDVAWAGLAGALAGGFTAWWFTAWLLRRFKRAILPGKVVAVLIGLPALYGCAALTVDMILTTVSLIQLHGWRSLNWTYPQHQSSEMTPYFILIAAAAGGCTAATVRARRVWRTWWHTPAA